MGQSVWEGSVGVIYLRGECRGNLSERGVHV